MGLISLSSQGVATVTEQEFWDILFDVPDPKPVFFRLYYNNKDGTPLFYSMEDVPGTYIEIDADIYALSSMRVRVQDGKIIEISCRPTYKLTPGNVGNQCHPQDVAVINNSADAVKWIKQKYETN
jgi:hypothetical protein